MVKRFLESKEGHIDLRRALESIAATESKCEEKIYGMGAGGDG